MDTKAKVINGLSFDIRQPYNEGHVLSALEARVLNQTRAENVGNNARAKIKEMQDEGADDASIVAYVTELDAGYEFRVASDGAGRTRDPYETEARKIAKELIKSHLAQTGRKINVTPDGESEDSWKEKIEDQIDKLASSEKVLAAAKKTVDARKKQSETLMAALEGAEL